MLINIVAFVFVFGLIVLVHEFGHFLAARQAGVVVQEFGIGYPPRVKTLAVRDGVEYTLNAIPVGGFVKLLGEEDPDQPGSLASKGAWARVRVMAAGSIMNILLAVVMFTATFLLGYQVLVGKVYIASVSPGSPAAEAGFQPEDDIRAVDGQEITSVDGFSAAMHAAAGRAVDIVVMRNGQELTLQVTPRVNPPPGEGALGVVASIREGYEIRTIKPSFPQSIQLGLAEVGKAVVMTVGTFAGLIRGLVSPRNLAGPIGIFQITGMLARSGLADLVYFVGLLSTNLFVVNLLPFPALDGGRIAFVLIEKVRGKRVTPEAEAKIHALGLLFLLAFMLIVSYFDIMRLLNR